MRKSKHAYPERVAGTVLSQRSVVDLQLEQNLGKLAFRLELAPQRLGEALEGTGPVDYPDHPSLTED